jgi:hypothetical protein
MRCNPFVAATHEEWAGFAVLQPSIIEAVEANGNAIQLLGERGRGKSTTLRGLEQWLTRRGQRAAYEYLSPGKRHYSTTLGANLDAFLLDEVQRLWWWSRWRLLNQVIAHQIRLIFASHRDLTALLRLKGLELQSFRLGNLHHAQLDMILARRLDYFAVDGRSRVRFSQDAIAYLLERFGSDQRAIEYYLYEVFQSLSRAEIGLKELVLAASDLQARG